MIWTGLGMILWLDMTLTNEDSRGNNAANEGAAYGMRLALSCLALLLPCLVLPCVALSLYSWSIGFGFYAYLYATFLHTAVTCWYFCSAPRNM